jgi:hypothetical protein
MQWNLFENGLKNMKKSLSVIENLATCTRLLGNLFLILWVEGVQIFAHLLHPAANRANKRYKNITRHMHFMQHIYIYAFHENVEI